MGFVIRAVLGVGFEANVCVRRKRSVRPRLWQILNSIDSLATKILTGRRSELSPIGRSDLNQRQKILEIES